MCCAVTDEGIEVPLIDVTHPGFRVELAASLQVTGAVVVLDSPLSHNVVLAKGAAWRAGR